MRSQRWPSGPCWRTRSDCAKRNGRSNDALEVARAVWPPHAPAVSLQVAIAWLKPDRAHRPTRGSAMEIVQPNGRAGSKSPHIRLEESGLGLFHTVSAPRERLRSVYECTAA